MNFVGIITARGGSKGIPGKNIRTLAGKPLIAWTIEAALQSKLLTDVMVSTDDPEIAKIANNWGAKVPFLRPSELATDTASHVSVINHFINHPNTGIASEDYFLILQPTSPLRNSSDIDNAISMTLKNNANALVSVMPIHPHTAHPALAKIISEDGTIHEYGNREPDDCRRQMIPPAYAVNGAIYVIKNQYFQEIQDCCPSGALAYVMPPERCIDIDTPWDFHLAELILTSNYEQHSH
jgi:CMP-N,N'-diacetyllegionaminic acid synthase